MVWHLYDKKYNLDDYLAFHPGGKTILENTRDVSDITALFETYHAFSNKEYYKKKLEGYEILDPSTREPDLYRVLVEKEKEKEKDNYDFTTYHLLTERIRKIFPNRKSIKAPTDWYIQNGIMFFLYVSTFYGAMFCKNYPIFYRIILSQIAGVSFISLGFNVFHDGSHYAISIKPKVNQILAKIWASWGIWNATIWFYHHVLHHHSHTGLSLDPSDLSESSSQNRKRIPFEDPKDLSEKTIPFDPDMYHLLPFARKTSASKKTIPLLHNRTEWLPFVMIGFPGYYIGQVLSYLVSANYKNKIFRASLPIGRNYYDGVDIGLILAKIYCLYHGGIVTYLNYTVALNFWYFINIALDHDTYESNVENHYSGKDWLKMQVCHSANFLNGNVIWTLLFGSINYQIEHHLFPNMSSVHYPIIAPVVREFCQEHGIPYVHHDTLVGAFRSYMKMIKFRNRE
jgi:linoleoyl-CoA desaturase